MHIHCSLMLRNNDRLSWNLLARLSFPCPQTKRVVCIPPTSVSQKFLSTHAIFWTHSGFYIFLPPRKQVRMNRENWRTIDLRNQRFRPSKYSFCNWVSLLIKRLKNMPWMNGTFQRFSTTCTMEFSEVTIFLNLTLMLLTFIVRSSTTLERSQLCKENFICKEPPNRISLSQLSLKLATNKWHQIPSPTWIRVAHGHC